MARVLDGASVGKAFGLSAVAGACTGLGGLVAIFYRDMSKSFLAGALGLAAGVMVYVSLVEIYAVGSVTHFTDAGISPNNAFSYATLSMGAAIPVVIALDKLVHLILAYAQRRATRNVLTPSISKAPICSDNDQEQGCRPEASALVTLPSELTDKGKTDNGTLHNIGADSQLLLHTSILTGLALFLHNIPEGLITFTSYVSSESSGVAVLIAIAVHNIPEGIVVAASVYFATKSRTKAVLWAAVTGVAEPLGALIGVGIMYGGSMTDEVLGVIMGMVAGIMVVITVRELIPRALFFDPKGQVVSWSIIAGMAIMAVSLVMLNYLDNV